MSSTHSSSNTQNALSQKKAIHGERNGASKLTDHEVDLLLTIYETSQPSYAKLAALFGVSKSCVFYICTGHTRYRRD